MTKDTGDTVKLLRPPPRVFTETKGQTVWMGEIQALDLEIEPDPQKTDPYNNSPALHP
ncbi:MAG: hypothetical protein AAFN50_14500 [Pseudomonadota bacterium]